MSRVELFERIRQDNRREGLSIRALARRHRVHRRAVRQALSSAVPPARKCPDRQAPQLGPWKDTIRAWLKGDLLAPRKQRHTARRVWERLVGELQANVAESTVRAYVREARREIGQDLSLMMVPQTHGPGEEAEVDFGEFEHEIDGAPTRCWMFVMRLSASGKAFHAPFFNESMESFLEGHVRAFARLGGLPKRIRYDNLKLAAVKVLLGRDRVENQRFIAFRSHYGFESFYCIPGPEGAHEKGGVEGEIGRFRRRHLVPVPKVSSFHELEGIFEKADAADNARVIEGRRQTVGEGFALEAPRLQPLPAEHFDFASQLVARVDRKSRVCVRQSFYSVPCRFMDRKVAVQLRGTSLDIVVDGKVVAHHVRALRKGTETLVLDHYLEVLAYKPGALAGATALHQARASGAFTRAHDNWWTLARRRLGDQDGTRALVEVLLAHRRLPAHAMEAALDAAIRASIVDSAAVIIEARRRIEPEAAATALAPMDLLARYDHPAPTLASYDRLLGAAV